MYAKNALAKSAEREIILTSNTFQHKNMLSSEYGCPEILAHYARINIVPHRKDWSIFCFDLADDLVPFKTKSAKTRLENDGLLIVDH